MSEEAEPISQLQLWQFSISYEDLPFREGSYPYIDNGLYRSKGSPYVYVFHTPDKWDCFVPR